jgi:hypothetical protein
MFKHVAYSIQCVGFRLRGLNWSLVVGPAETGAKCILYLWLNDFEIIFTLVGGACFVGCGFVLLHVLQSGKTPQYRNSLTILGDNFNKAKNGLSCPESCLELDFGVYGS